MKRRISSLKHHPSQQTIYPITDEAVKSLAENIATCGQLEPCLITKDSIIISGYTRIAALELLGKKTCEVKVLDIPEEEQVYYLISSNKQRVKDYNVRLAEVDELTKYYSKGKGYRSDLEEPTTHQGSKRRKNTLDKVAADLGMSKNTIHQLKYIRNRRPDLIEHIGKTITLQSCYFQVKMWFNQKSIAEDKEKRSRKTKYAGDRFIIYKKPAEKMLEVLTEDSLDLVITSPPYFQQRVFDHQATELGQEQSPEEFIERLLVVFEQCKRALKITGSIIVNMGDSYINGGKAQIPERLSIAIADKLGLTLRNTLIWHKTHAAPESTNRRRHTDYEYFYHFVRDRQAYFYDADKIRIPYAQPDKKHDVARPPRHYTDLYQGVNPRWVNIATKGMNEDVRYLSNVGSSLRHPLGKMPGSILPYSNHKPNLKLSDVEHTASFPEDLIREVMKPVVDEDFVVCDPFSGSATSGVIALEMGAQYIGFEINEKFVDLSCKRLENYQMVK